MYCIKCGTELDNSMKFCPGCGSKVERVLPGEELPSSEMTFTKAVELAKNGRDEGFQFLYEKTNKNKLYIAMKYMKNEDAAMDIL